MPQALPTTNSVASIDCIKCSKAGTSFNIPLLRDGVYDFDPTCLLGVVLHIVQSGAIKIELVSVATATDARPTCAAVKGFLGNSRSSERTKQEYRRRLWSKALQMFCARVPVEVFGNGEYSLLRSQQGNQKAQAHASQAIAQGAVALALR